MLVLVNDGRERLIPKTGFGYRAKAKIQTYPFLPFIHFLDRVLLLPLAPVLALQANCQNIIF